MTSTDGYQWTESEGLRPGVPSIGVIQPATNLKDSTEIFDVIVVGGGYCGLTAARDASASGLGVLLLEARDRIGGRSWSSNIGGYPFEMGGTWIHWGQPHVWREISRYQMRDQIEISFDFTRGINQHFMTSEQGVKMMSHEEEDSIAESALGKLVNVDGEFGRKLMPFPHSATYNPEALKYDHMSVADRVAEIKDTLSPNELTSLASFVLLCSGGTLETTSFFEFLHWWALSQYSYKGCIEHLIKYKFHNGQSSFAINFFREALASGRLKYSFNTPITSIRDTEGTVEVTARSGLTYKASRVICTIPLNVLSTITFDPPLESSKSEAASTGHVNQCIKVHAEVHDRDMHSWTGINYPNSKLFYGIGDGETPAGNTHIVAFGGQHNHFEPEEDINEALEALRELAPMDIERVVFHNWSKDEFAKGAWFFPPPGFLTKYLLGLRSRQGNVFFANSDWAVGWRSFIDGAIEEGTRAALGVITDLTRPHL